MTDSERSALRFWRKVRKAAASECWAWTGARMGGVYGGFTPLRGARAVYAHRFSFEIHKGPIALGLVIDHRCRNTLCVNPAHLDAVTPRENIRRGFLPGPIIFNNGRALDR